MEHQIQGIFIRFISVQITHNRPEHWKYVPQYSSGLFTIDKLSICPMTNSLFIPLLVAKLFSRSLFFYRGRVLRPIHAGAIPYGNYDANTSVPHRTEKTNTTIVHQFKN